MNAAEPANTKDARDFERLVVWVSTFSVAVMAGFIASIKQVNPVLQFKFSLPSIVAFIAGGVLTFLFLRFLLVGKVKHRGLFVIAVAILSLIGYFLFGIKNASPESRTDVIIGAIIAFMALSFVGWLLWGMSRIFEHDHEQNTQE